MRPFFVLATVVLLLSIRLPMLAFEPAQLDPSQGSEPEVSSYIDHLQPVKYPFGPLPEFHYLVQYLSEITKENYHYVIIVRDPSSGRYYVEQGDAPKLSAQGRPYRFKRRIEISADTAKLVYNYWVTMLSETRYARKKLPYTPPVTVYMFSALAPIGWLHGYTLVPGVSTDLPPYWISQAGEMLFNFATKTREEAQLAARVTELRDKSYEYLKSHQCE